GAFFKYGAGTMELTAAGNTFNSGIVVSNGLLIITNAGRLNSGSYSGFITNYAAIQYSSTASQTLSGTMYGTGSLALNGPGTVTISGNSPLFTGPISISTGETIFNTGAVVGGTVTVASAATNAVQVNSSGGQATLASLTFNSGTTYQILNF